MIDKANDFADDEVLPATPPLPKPDVNLHAVKNHSVEKKQDSSMHDPALIDYYQGVCGGEG